VFESTMIEHVADLIELRVKATIEIGNVSFTLSIWLSRGRTHAQKTSATCGKPIFKVPTSRRFTHPTLIPMKLGNATATVAKVSVVIAEHGTSSRHDPPQFTPWPPPHVTRQVPGGRRAGWEDRESEEDRATARECSPGLPGRRGCMRRRRRRPSPTSALSCRIGDLGIMTRGRAHPSALR
jgi:hypothetical protein